MEKFRSGGLLIKEAKRLKAYRDGSATISSSSHFILFNPDFYESEFFFSTNSPGYINW